ncbi:MAG: HsdR family type I site-specific deoxyribonuclease [Chloroflexi bacterium]|nr:HsdR family type I site-specific deoxyribonuclease [Chloroflexota bacterium]MCI0730177.1 HsdR family type I site-specific deoxyribonuclease [Chloroflexota bacterium]
MIKYAGQVGWQVAGRKQALQWRGGDGGLFFSDILRQKLMDLNPGVVDEAAANEIIRQLNLLPATIAGNQAALEWLRGERSVFVPAENRERNVRLVDFDDFNHNVYHVTGEWRCKNPRFANRADVVFLVNGVPVATCETKSAGKPDGLAEAVAQIRRYERETPELLLSSQVFEVTELFRFLYAPTWNAGRKALANWKTELGATGDSPAEIDYETAVKTFFNRRRFLALLQKHILFLTKDDELSKVILRQHQTRAVDKAVERVYDPGRRRGLIWHTQGSGKTLTMITIAALLLQEAPGGEKPTVLMLVDRNELETQLFRNITGYGIGNVAVAQSKRDLRALLASDYRGLVVSMIHKFDKADANLNLRPSVVVLVDEAHRTTGGDLGNYLMAALPNATYIGFTGTPIDRLAKGQGTFKTFGGDDPQGYLDKYSIAESIADGTTVRLHYSLAPSDLLVDRETLDREFLELREAEGVSEIEEVDAVLSRAVALKEMMKAGQRVANLAHFVAQDFRERIEPMGFKAFLVAVDREACALYKEALDPLLPEGYCEVVYSPAHNDPELLQKYHLSPEREKAIRLDFARKDKLPKLLIVTEKLLTGYDAPILYCMYLDKPMRDHVLLQTVARVNRPYEDDGEDQRQKEMGLIVDFVGIFERLEKALAFDSDVVAAVIQNIDVLHNLFETMMGEQAPAYLPLTAGWDDKAKERAVLYFEEKEKREQFFKFFRQVQNLYDILSPSAALRPFMDDYQALAVLYGMVRSAYSNQPYVDREFTQKTKALLRRHTVSGDIEPPTVIYEIGPKQLQVIKDSDSADTVKVLNLRKLLAVLVDEEGGNKPYLLSIGERAEWVAQAYEDRQITTQEALARFEALVQEANEADGRRQALEVDENTFAIYTTLAAMNSQVTAQQARDINQLFLGYPDYQWNAQQEDELRSELYIILIPVVGIAHYLAATNALLALERVGA